MQLSGSCHCQKIQFSVTSRTPYPFMLCYCTLCRKTAGSGGYAINLLGYNRTLFVNGRKHIRIYQATINGSTSEAHRHFCGFCGSGLWIWDSRWPELVHPFASAIDTKLPRTPAYVHIMLQFAPEWVERPQQNSTNQLFNGYPDTSIENWHQAHGLYEE